MDEANQYCVDNRKETMPIDKFGRHMLRSKPYSTSSSIFDTTPFYICEPKSFTTPCALYIKGQGDITKSVTYYVLDNGNISYALPVSGMVKDINIIPNVQLTVDGQKINKKEIIGRKFKKGVELRFHLLKSEKLGESAPLYVELIVNCPLERK